MFKFRKRVKIKSERGVLAKKLIDIWADSSKARGGKIVSSILLLVSSISVSKKSK